MKKKTKRPAPRKATTVAAKKKTKAKPKQKAKAQAKPAKKPTRKIAKPVAKKIATSRGAPLIPVVDVSREQGERNEALSAQLDALMAGAMQAAKEENIEPERVAAVRMIYDTIKAQIAMREQMADHERMMHAARVLHGWTTLEQIESRIAAANEGDEEAVREIVEIVELVKSGSDVPDAS